MVPFASLILKVLVPEVRIWLEHGKVVRSRDNILLRGVEKGRGYTISSNPTARGMRSYSI